MTKTVIITIPCTNNPSDRLSFNGLVGDELHIGIRGDESREFDGEVMISNDDENQLLRFLIERNPLIACGIIETEKLKRMGVLIDEREEKIDTLNCQLEGARIQAVRDLSAMFCPVSGYVIVSEESRNQMIEWADFEGKCDFEDEDNGPK